jgi:hypothetical protein
MGEKTVQKRPESFVDSKVVGNKERVGTAGHWLPPVVVGQVAIRYFRRTQTFGKDAFSLQVVP